MSLQLFCRAIGKNRRGFKKKQMSSWADLCEDEELPWIPVKTSPKQKALKSAALQAPKSPSVPPVEGPVCYCGEPSVLDKVKKSGKREKIGTPFVTCAKGICKYWFTLPVPQDLPVVSCLCEKPAAACPVKNPESRHFGKYISTCAFGECKFYKINE